MSRLAISGLVKGFGFAPVLKGIDLVANEGERIALVGENGSGKSTLLRVLALLQRPEAGAYTLEGRDALKDSVGARALIGYLGHESGLDRAQTVRENLTLFAKLYGVRDATQRVDELLERFGLNRLALSPVAELSRGQEQAAGLARACVHQPLLLLLDEPANALDDAARARLWGALREESVRGATVIFSTHDAASAQQATCTVRLSGGKLA
ncbi:MAG: heme ABC exporter ATP-binding protein CcmA [Planctomycetes bacterium]|nr:heme ABC exporter ATP-binding protein CcmA [Planctomycetota bacterium]